MAIAQEAPGFAANSGLIFYAESVSVRKIKEEARMTA
jgi:hypothetical protein